MATNDDYLRLRRMTGETDSTTYEDTDLDIFIQQAGGDLNGAAALVWGEKAGSYADLVNISEAGSSRSNSDLFTHARTQADYFASISAVDPTAPATSGTQVRKIVRS